MNHVYITAAIVKKAAVTRKVKLGPPSLSNGLPNMTNPQRIAWPAFLDKYLTRIKKIKDPIMQWSQTIGWFDNFMKTFVPPKRVAKALQTKLPGKTILPENITSKGAKIWPKFWEKYGSQIMKIPTVEKQWAAAVAIFRNYCLKRDIIPFNNDPIKPVLTTETPKTEPAKDTKDYMQNRFSKAREKVKNKVQSLFKRFMITIGRKVYKEKLYSVAYNPKSKQFEIESVISMKVQQGTSPSAVKQYLEKIGLIKTKGGWGIDVGPHTITAKRQGDTIDVFNTIRFTKAQILSLLGLPEKSTDEKIIKRLTKKIKLEMKDKSVMISAIGLADKESAEEIDFEEPLSEEDQATIERSLANISPNDAFLTYSVDYIRSLGDPVYQYNLTKALIDKFGENETWQYIVDNPSSMLDPKKITDLEDLDTKNPESGI